MQLRVDPQGRLHGVYTELLDFTALGTVHIRRASLVEPDAAGLWWADLKPVGGPVLGPYPRRSEALAAEQAWLESYWLPAAGQPSRTPPPTQAAAAGSRGAAHSAN
jgi:hypothetical protein